MGKSVRAYAHADINLPEGWDGDNTAIEFSVTVTHDSGQQVFQEDIEIEMDEVQEYGNNE